MQRRAWPRPLGQVCVRGCPVRCCPFPCRVYRGCLQRAGGAGGAVPEQGMLTSLLSTAPGSALSEVLAKLVTEELVFRTRSQAQTSLLPEQGGRRELELSHPVALGMG